MSHAVLCLRAKGPQDALLTVSPEITFFKSVYPRHTNFAFSDTEVVPSSGVPGFGRTIEFQLPRSGDLINTVYLYVELPPITEWLNTAPTLGNAWWKIFDPLYDDVARLLIKKVEFRIGGYTVEEMTGEFMHVWDQLSRDPSTSRVETAPTRHGGVQRKNGGNQAGMKTGYLYIPLQFSFCIEDGMALPMIALQYHDARIRVTLAAKDEIFTQLAGGPLYPATTLNGGALSWDHASVGNTGYRAAMMNAMVDITKMRLLCRYIFLDDFERRQFAVNPHEYLITETQQYDHFVDRTDLEMINLSFSHPVKELIFFYKADDRLTSAATSPIPTAAPWNFVNVNSKFGDGHLFETANITLNSQQMFGEGRDPVYFSYLLPMHHHTRVPRDKHIYVIPFALQPEDWKPTGSINFSRLDSVKLVLKGMNTTLPKGVITIYARSFNILKITNGMGGKRFAS